jgi:hypothetical protein
LRKKNFYIYNFTFLSTFISIITGDNVLDIISIAEEYQVTRIINRSKPLLKKWLNDEFETARKGKYTEDYVKPARNCLYILKTAVMVNYSELVTLGVEIVSQFGHRIYLGLHKTYFIAKKEMFSECTEVFNSLPADVKYDVLARRLALYPDNDFKVVQSVKLGKQVSQSGN